MNLRPYQTETVDAVMEEFKTNHSTLVVAATGVGKTVTFCHVIKEFLKKGRVLVIAHREELLAQAADKIEKIIGIRPDVEMADSWADEQSFLKSPIIVSSIQTQTSGAKDRRRMWRFKPHEFSLLIIDECFPAGTPVDGKPIESLRVGDTVTSFDGDHVCERRIVGTFRSVPHHLCVVRIAERSITCTPGHPFFTQRGFVPAAHLTEDDLVAGALCDVQDDLHRMRPALYGDTCAPHLLPAMRDRKAISATDADSRIEMYGMRSRREGAGAEAERVRSQGPGVLQRGMRQGVLCQTVVRNNGNHESPLCLCAHEGRQPNEEGQSAGEGVGHLESHEVEACRTGRQWHGADASAAKARIGVGLADGSCGGDWTPSGGLPVVLQSRRSATAPADCNRSGWKQPQHSWPQKAGSQERRVLAWHRVDSVTVYEQPSRHVRDRLCPDGLVYNIEVEGTHNYFADGHLVHNCHHTPAATYQEAIRYYRTNPNLKLLGVTATPDRADEQALGQIFESVAHEYEILDAIQDGWLVPIWQQFAHVAGLDFSRCGTTAGDLNGRDLANVMEYEAILHRVLDPTLTVTGDKKTLIFASSVAHAKRMCEIINRPKNKPGSAAFVCGKTDKDERRDILDRFAEGRLQYLCNVGITTEGYDCPDIECIVMARPTKSRALYCQMCGRGTRPLDGLVDQFETSKERRQAIAESRKPEVLILDFVGVSGKHKLISTADILGGKYEDDIVALAAKNAKKKAGPIDMTEELERAIEEQKRLEERERKRRRRLTAKADWKLETVNPFSVLDVRPRREPGWHKGQLPSTKQVALLEKFGVKNSDRMTFHEANTLIGSLISRMKSKKCSYRQAIQLRRFGYDTNVSFKAASEIMGRLAANGWKKPA